MSESWSPTLRQLSYVIALAEAGHFGRAAASCGVTQPALSKALHELERGLGLAIFDRRPDATVPTPEGEALLAHARAVLAARDALLVAAAGRAGEPTGPVKLGVIPTIAAFWLPTVLEAVGALWPAAEPQVVEARTADLADAVRRGAVDLAVVALPWPADDLVAVELFTEPLLLAVPSSDPLAGEGPVPASALAEIELLLLEQGHCLREHVLQACPLAKVPTTWSATTLPTLLWMVASGRGRTLVPAMARDIAPPGVCLRPIADPAPSRTIGLWWRTTHPRVAAWRALGRRLTASRGASPRP